MPKVQDLVQQRFGMLLVKERAENDKDGRTRWVCECECGNTVIVLGKSLRTGHTQSCGCLNRKRVKETSFKDHTGQVFGLLTVISRSDDYISPSGRHCVRWLCRCSCGNETITSSNQLVTGRTKSCGCLRTGNTKHGGRKDRLYKVYHNMKNRCYNENSKDFKYYGGRGIKICDDWLNDYLSFKEWAYDNGYDDTASFGKCTIDRIDVNKGYEPSNCRWVDMKVQSNNKRNNLNCDLK